MNTQTEINLTFAAAIARLVIEVVILLVLWFRMDAIKAILVGLGDLAAKVTARAWTPVMIDGVLWAAIALFAFQQAYLSSDESYKYASPWFLFWLKFAIGSIAAVAGSLKAFRSTTYSESRKPANPVLTPPPAGVSIAPTQNQPAPDAGAQPTGTK